MSAPLPWQTGQWHGIRSTLTESRLPHALLLRGPRGVGKQQFAERLGALLLCTAPHSEHRPCGQCQGCHLLGAGAHPDFVRVTPEEDSRVIKIDQIRELIASLTFTRQLAAHKVAIVHPAEAMQRPAANSLLKTLEEPPGATVFLLVSHHSALLPATIRSRCQRIDFPLPTREEGLAWLQPVLEDGHDAALHLALAGGAPLAAVELAAAGAVALRDGLFEEVEGLVRGTHDAVAVAARWRSVGAGAVTGCLDQLACDLVRLHFRAPARLLTNGDIADAMQSLAERLDSGHLFGLLDRLADAHGAALVGRNPNELLLLEGVAIAWQRAGRRD